MSRKHSKYSASGAERWFNCSGSIALSEGLPDKDTPWSLEGTAAHEVLEKILRAKIKKVSWEFEEQSFEHTVMVCYARQAADHIFNLYAKADEIMVESKVSLGFIHPEAFGSLDAAVIEHFGVLDILDYKYGFTLVSPKENLQFLFYALAVAYAHHWNFNSVRMWTLQPRVKGFDGFVFWEISIEKLKSYIPKFEAAIERVEKYPNKYTEGPWCHFCKAKGICPLKDNKKLAKLSNIFEGI